MVSALGNMSYSVAARPPNAERIRFPFHLRPKQKRAYQYLRMVVDMIRDLELDQSPSGSNEPEDVTPNRVDSVRTYLSCYYLITA